MHLQTIPKLLMSRIIPDTIPIHICRVVPSDDVLYTDTSEVNHQGTFKLLTKSVTIPGGYESVTVRVKFNLKTSNEDYYAYGRIYKNGFPLDDSMTTYSLTYVEFIKDLTLSPGDSLQLWIQNQSELEVTSNDVFTVSGKEVLTSGTVGQEWRAPLGRSRDGIEAYLSKEAEDYFSEADLSEDYLSEEDI